MAESVQEKVVVILSDPEKIGPFLDYKGLAYLLEQLQTTIVGTPGQDGKDAKITGVTFTIVPGHLDEPTATAEVTGEPGDQKIHITMTGIQGADGLQGPAGEEGTPGTPGLPGKDAAIASADASITTEGIETPAVRVTLGGETGAQTMHFDFDLPLTSGGGGGIIEWPGTSDQVLMGDGTPKDLEEFWKLLDTAIQESHDRALEDMKSKLQTAQDTLASASKSTDGSDVAEDAKWVDDSTYDALQQAITDATEAQGSPDSKDAQELKDLADRLDAATKAFENAKKDGTKASESNKEGLGSAATEAQSTLDGVTSSTDGSDVPADKEWVDQEKYQELQDAIEEANGLAQNDNATKEQVDQSKQRLEAAKEAVESGKQAGSKVTDEHKQQMQQKLTEAQALLASASRSADGSDVDSSSYWVDEDTYDAFKNAIDALDALNKNENASDADVLDALGTLDSTSTAFSTAKKPGTKAGYEPGTDLGSISPDDLDSWSSDAAQNPETYSELLDGKTATLELSGIGSCEIFIVGIGQDELADGSGKAGFTFQFKNIIEEARMNATNSTTGGWRDSEMRSQEMQKIYDAMPASWKSKIKKVKKKTYNKVTGMSSGTGTATGSELTETEDYMFLMSGSEYGPATNNGGDGSNQWKALDEGEPYAYYSKNPNMAAHIKQHQGVNDWYWTRSISVVSGYESASFRGVHSGGYLHSGGGGASGTDGGVAPCFCI